MPLYIELNKQYYYLLPEKIKNINPDQEKFLQTIVEYADRVWEQDQQGNVQILKDQTPKRGLDLQEFELIKQTAKPGVGLEWGKLLLQASYLEYLLDQDQTIEQLWNQAKQEFYLSKKYQEYSEYEIQEYTSNLDSSVFLGLLIAINTDNDDIDLRCKDRKMDSTLEAKNSHQLTKQLAEIDQLLVSISSIGIKKRQ